MSEIGKKYWLNKYGNDFGELVDKYINENKDKKNWNSKIKEAKKLFDEMNLKFSFIHAYSYDLNKHGVYKI